MHIIERYSAPTKHCFEPYGTQWRYTDTDGSFICFLQMSRDEANPHWIPLGDLLAYVFWDRLEDQEFMRKTMESYAIKE